MKISIAWYVGFVAILLLLAVSLYYWRARQAGSQGQVFSHLAGLISEIFSCLTTPDYLGNLYLFERRIHKQKIKCMTAVARLSADDAAAGAQALTLLELIVDLGQVRRRVTDHTIFSLCHDELQSLEKYLAALLKSLPLNKPQQALLDNTASHINQFESVYVSVMSVVAIEPVVFILFVNALRALHKQCKEILS